MFSSWAEKLGRFDDAVTRAIVEERAKDVVMEGAEDGAEMGAEGAVRQILQVTMQGIVLVDLQKEEEEAMALAPPEETIPQERKHTTMGQTYEEQQKVEQQKVVEEQTRPVELPEKTLAGGEAQQDLTQRGPGSEQSKATLPQQNTYSSDELKESGQRGLTSPSPPQQQKHTSETAWSVDELNEPEWSGLTSRTPTDQFSNDFATMFGLEEPQSAAEQNPTSSTRISLSLDQGKQATTPISTSNPFAVDSAKPNRRESEALMLHNLYKEHFIESTEQEIAKASLQEYLKISKAAERQKAKAPLKPIVLFPKKPHKTYPRLFSPTSQSTPSWILEAKKKNAGSDPQSATPATQHVSNASPDLAPKLPAARSTSHTQARVQSKTDTDRIIHSLLLKPAHTTQEKDDRITELATHVRRLMKERDAANGENVVLRAAANRARQDNRRLVHNQSMRWIGWPDQPRLR